MNTMNLIQDAPVMVMAPDDYDRARQRHMQAFVAQVPGEVEKLAWPLERLHAMRDARLRALVRTAKERSPWHAERLRIAPRALAVAAEPLLPEARQAIEETFAAPLLNSYACSEAGLIAWSYPGSPGLHLVEDAAVYEPADALNRPVAAGAPAAKLLVTNVINQALPLIRYELTDELTLLSEPNPGPWTGRRISEVQGRLDDHFSCAGGVDVHPHVFRSALAGAPEVTEYQVRQTARGAAIVAQATGMPDRASVRDRISLALTRLDLADPQVTITRVARIERLDGTGKLKRFVAQAA